MKLSTFKYYFLIFIIGSFIGWIYEEFFYYFTEDIISNRGFLYGCYLPIYGYGSVLIVMLLKRLKKYPILIFLLSLLLTGIVEYIGGFILEEFFNLELWTYEGLLLNINNYVCLRSVLTFAIGGTLLIYLIEPYIYKITKKENYKIVNYFLLIFLIIFIIDNTITFIFRY